jgi:hypothetical protein
MGDRRLGTDLLPVVLAQSRRTMSLDCYLPATASSKMTDEDRHLTDARDPRRGPSSASSESRAGARWADGRTVDGLSEIDGA